MKLYLLTTALLALALPAAAAPILTPSTTTYGGILNGSNFATGAPTNTFSPRSNGRPSAQGPTKAVDNLIGPGSKYLNLNVNNTALLFVGNTQRVANRMELWVAEDAVERDPASYILYGTNTVINPLSGGTVFGLPSFGFVEISAGTLALPATRDVTGDATGFSQIVPIPNTTAYDSVPTAISGDGNEKSFTFPPAPVNGVPKRFYRLQVSQP